jgi:hypothetical protein
MQYPFFFYLIRVVVFTGIVEYVVIKLVVIIYRLGLVCNIYKVKNYYCTCLIELLNLHELNVMGIDSYVAYDIALNNYDFDRIVASHHYQYCSSLWHM